MEDNFRGEIKTSYIDSTPWWPEVKRPPKDAPNVLYIILDDTGYSQIGCYGSLVETPNIDALAADGLRYSDFHVNAMCSPTRASLLTGCNNHTVGFSYLGNNDFGFPSLRGEVPSKYCFISEILRDAGYFTCTTGKWHLVNDAHMTGAGPYDNWPSGKGFDKSYTLLHASTSQYYPTVVRGNEIVDPPFLPDEGYQFGADIVDNAIRYIGDQKSTDPEKPFFCYLAFGAMHGPHHAPKEYIDRYKGKFDMGWDKYRELVFEKQKKLGIIPQDAVLTERNKMVEAWDSLSDREKKVFARYMEVFAGFLTYTDEQIGRIVDYLKAIEQYDNTLIVFLTDNGASAEGGPNGCFNEFYHIYTMEWGDLVSEDEMDLLGGETANANYPTGWAWAGNTPLKWYKSWVHAGGVKVPLIMTYPKLIKDKGGIRPQFHYVTDINATVLDICGLEVPEYLNGVKQEPKHGVSMRYSFESADAPRQRRQQYFEMHGNRGMWCDGWKAVTNHVDSPSFEDDVWELYHTDEDFSEAKNVADQYPEKLEELKTLWWHEAGKYGVLPLIESHFRNINGFNFNQMWFHSPHENRKHYVWYPQMSPSFAKPMFGNKSFFITSHVDYRKGDEGVLFGGGVDCGGFVIYVENGKFCACYNFLQKFYLDMESKKEIPEGKHDLVFDFVKTGDHKGVARLLIDGEEQAELLIDTFPLFPMPGQFSVCRYGSSPIKPSHRNKADYFRYTGSIHSVELEMERPMDDIDKIMELAVALGTE